MDHIEFSPFEERLYALCSSSREVERYKRSAVTTGMMFSLLFLGATYAVESSRPIDFHWLMALILILYAGMNCAVICNFGRALGAYRGILEKLATRLLARTKDPRYEELVKQSADDSPERGVKRAILLLTAFFVTVILALLLLPAPHKMWCAAGAVVFLLLLTARIKCTAANAVIEYKKLCFEHGTELRKRTWPS